MSSNSSNKVYVVAAAYDSEGFGPPAAVFTNLPDCAVFMAHRPWSALRVFEADLDQKPSENSEFIGLPEITSAVPDGLIDRDMLSGSRFIALNDRGS